MISDSYCIVRAGENWSLRLNGDQLAVFPDREQATRAANAAARMSRSRGRPAEVLLDDASPERSVIQFIKAGSGMKEDRNGGSLPDGGKLAQRIGTAGDLSFAGTHLG